MTTQKAEKQAAIESAALLPCPFCGHSASITEQESPSGGGRIVWTPGCDSDDCSAAMYGGHATKKQAVADWNTRQQLEAQKSQGWVYCKDRLPEVGELRLWQTVSGNFIVGYLGAESRTVKARVWRVGGSSFEFVTEFVAHRALPEPAEMTAPEVTK